MKKKKYSKNNLQQQFQEEKPGIFKNRRKLSLLIVGAVVFLMIISVVSYSFTGSDNQQQNQENTIDYNGHKFTNVNGNWITSISGQQISFQNNPKELENITIQIGLYLLKEKVYIAFNPKEMDKEDYELQTLKSLVQTQRQNVQLACITEEDCGDMPIVNCNNQNSIIYLKQSTETKGYTEASCIILEAPEKEQNRIIERFYYKLIGVMQ